jgi:cell cycle sensor histidine kinase DivJ
MVKVAVSSPQESSLVDALLVRATDHPIVAAAAVVVVVATALALRLHVLPGRTMVLRGLKEPHYDLLARHMSDVITHHDVNGVVLFTSPAAERVFGVAAEKLLGNGLFERVLVADRPAFLKTLTDVAASGESRAVEFRARRHSADDPQSSSFIWIEMRCRPLAGIRAGDGRLRKCQVVAVMREITERKMQEEALDHARALAERANDAKGRFLATMSHELRTPLNAIIGFSELLMNEDIIPIDGARRRDYANLINESGHHLLSVVNGILDMSKIETGRFEITPEPFAPAAVIRGCCDLLVLKAREAGVELVMRVPDGLPEIVADKRALKQILLNLISNAIKFTDRGGRVTVAAARDADAISLSIEDTGVGIGEDDLPRLGDPFFQARATYDRPYDGTGLGLSIVKGLVALHGGRVEIRSRLGEGTCVTVHLPLDCENAQRAAAASIACFPAHGRSNEIDQGEVRLRA